MGVGFGVGGNVVGVGNNLIEDGSMDGPREGSDDVGCIDGAVVNVMEGVDVLGFITMHQVVRTQVVSKVYTSQRAFCLLQSKTYGKRIGDSVGTPIGSRVGRDVLCAIKAKSFE